MYLVLTVRWRCSRRLCNPPRRWEPLCKFLGKPVPDGPFPHENDTRAFRRIVNGIRTVGTVVGVVALPVVVATMWLFPVVSVRAPPLLAAPVQRTPPGCVTAPRAVSHVGVSAFWTAALRRALLAGSSGDGRKETRMMGRCYRRGCGHPTVGILRRRQQARAGLLVGRQWSMVRHASSQTHARW